MGKRQDEAQLRAEKATKTFGKKGPYTFKEALRVARICAVAPDHQVGDLLQDIAYKFPPQEFRKLLNPKAYIPENLHKTWDFGAEQFHLKFLDESAEDGHLKEIAADESEAFTDIMENFEWDRLDESERALVLPILRSSLKRQALEGENDA